MGDVKKSSFLKSHGLPAAFKDPEGLDSDTTLSPPNSPVTKRLASAKVALPPNGPADSAVFAPKSGQTTGGISHSADEIKPIKKLSSSQPELRVTKNGT